MVVVWPYVIIEYKCFKIYYVLYWTTVNNIKDASSVCLLTIQRQGLEYSAEKWQMIHNNWFFNNCKLKYITFNFIFQPMEVYVDDEAKLTLHGLQQHYVKLKENEKNKKLFELLDVLEFNQVGFR